jgi:hypothetical protein
MKSLAQKRTDSSGTLSPVTYGSHYHNAETWDAEMRYSCYADEAGYVYTNPSAPSASSLSSYHPLPNYSPSLASASDLSQLLCPYGYDIRAIDAPPITELQTIRCRASSGAFYLSFRQFQSSLIDVTATLSDLKTILETTLGSIGAVEVTSSTSNTNICSGIGSASTVEIEFLTELSDQPLLVMTESEESPLAVGTGSVIFTVTETRTGSGRYLECSGKGVCNRVTGDCECWPSWGSSDGRGNQGARGDCGYNLIQ